MSASAAQMYLHFSRGAHTFAVPMERISAVCPHPLVQRFPEPIAELIGLFAHHGRMVALIDVHATTVDPDSKPAIAIISSSEQGELAFAADTVEGIFSQTREAKSLSPASEFARIRAAIS